jgi:type I restriction-modification system DNA methylase subunit
MNPPFEGSTGVKILKNVLDNVKPNSNVAFILPDRTLLTKNQTIVKQILAKHKLINIIKMPEET